jgi:hypothetical protein
MPTMILTPEEFARLPWYARQKAVNAHIREQRRKYDAPPQQSALEWAEAVREEARALHAAMPADPEASEHRAAVMS